MLVILSPVPHDLAKMQLYILEEGKVTGPFEEAEIISRWRKGILKDTDLVWTEGLDEWMPLAKLLSVSNSTQILPKNDESHSEKKTEPTSVKWYKRWQTWVAATATAFVLWLVLTAHSTQQGSAKFRAEDRNSTASSTEVPKTGQPDVGALRDEHNNPTSAPPSPSPVDDPVTSFQRGLAKLEQRKALVFNCTSSSNCEIRYDIRKTDSVVAPLVGIVTAKISEGSSGIFELHECQFSYKNARWKLEKAVYYIWNHGYSEPHDFNFMAPQIQDCFNAD